MVDEKLTHLHHLIVELVRKENSGHVVSRVSIEEDHLVLTIRKKTHEEVMAPWYAAAAAAPAKPAKKVR